MRRCFLFIPLEAPVYKRYVHPVSFSRVQQFYELGPSASEALVYMPLKLALQFFLLLIFGPFSSFSLGQCSPSLL